MRTIINRYISIDSTFCHGRPIFNGTRIPVATVLGLLEGGMDIPDILRGYPALTEAAIRAAIRYARQRIESEEFVPLAQ